MKKFWESYLRDNTFFWLFSAISIALIIASFVIPPLGIVDPSVLAAVGEIFGFTALGSLCKAIDKGTTATVRHRDTEIKIEKKNKSKKIED